MRLLRRRRGDDGGTNYTLDILRDIGLLVVSALLVLWPMTRLSADEYIARNDHVEAPSAKRLRSDQGRRKYNAMLEARRRAARSRTRWLTASVSAVVLLIVIIGLGVQSHRAKIQGSLVATHATASHGVVFGKKAAATVDVYEDFQCPNCLRFEESAGSVVEAAVRANRAQVRYHTMAFLDSSSSGNRYSSRAANAALCASDISVDAFFALHKLLFTSAVQPAEGTHGRTNAQLESYGTKSGISKTALPTFQQCVENEQHKALVEAITDDASKAGVNGTPTIFVNGKSISPTAAAFTAAVTKALKNGPAPSPSATPSPSPSVSSSGSAVGSGSAVPTVGSSPVGSGSAGPSPAARPSSAASSAAPASSAAGSSTSSAR